MRRISACFVVASFALLFAACSSSSSSSGNSCEGAGTAMCDKACSCSTDGKCRITSGGSDAGTTVFTFDSRQDCLSLSNLGCSNGGKSNVDYAACINALGTAACVDTPDGKAMQSPAACNSK